MLAVRDTGIGIPGRDLPRVFERFYRVDRARSRETGGTGLGLAIVKHVAENHGGTVRVQSELAPGRTFEVALPRAAKDGADRPVGCRAMALLFLIRHGLTAQTGRVLYGRDARDLARPSRPGPGRGARRAVRRGPAHRRLLEPARALRADRGAAGGRAAARRGPPRRAHRDGRRRLDRQAPDGGPSPEGVGHGAARTLRVRVPGWRRGVRPGRGARGRRAAARSRGRHPRGPRGRRHPRRHRADGLAHFLGTPLDAFQRIVVDTAVGLRAADRARHAATCCW